MLLQRTSKMVVDKMFKITSLGRKIAGKIQTEGRNPILDQLYSAPGRTATISELEATTGYSRGRLMGELRSMCRSGLVTELTSGGF